MINKEGLVSQNDYNEALKSPEFISLENFSNNFLKVNKEALKEYSKRWVEDPLHQWSRQYEYLFAYNVIRDYLKGKDSQNYTFFDAGSGVTFFPYLVAEQNANVSVTCFDSDSTLGSIFSNIVSTASDRVKFEEGKLQSISSGDSSVDLAYCISVLEHTGNFEAVLSEIYRI